MADPRPPTDPLEAAREDVRRAIAQAEDRVNQIKDAPTAEPPPLPDFGPIPPHPDRPGTKHGYGTLSRADTRDAIRLWSVAMNFVAGVVGGCFIGWLIDRWQGTNPYGVLIGCAIGLVGGFWGLMREVMRGSPPPKRKQ